jgi:hypothetical protein
MDFIIQEHWERAQQRCLQWYSLWDIFGKNQVVQGIEKPHTKSLPNTY